MFPRYTYMRGRAKIWTTERWDGDTAPLNPREGVVIGKRTLANGALIYGATDEWGYADEPDTFRPAEYFTAYLIAYDMRRNPVYVLPEHITPITEEHTA